MQKRYVPVDSELNALVPYDDSFKFFLSMDDLDEYTKGFVNWHKQPSIEISVVYEGAVNVYVLGQEQTVSAGDGFFILPEYLHSIRSVPGIKNAKYFTLIFYPEILYGTKGSYYEKAIYRPITDCNVPLFVFHQQDAWTKEVFPKLKWISENYSDASPEIRLQTQHILQDVWAEFACNLLQQSKLGIATQDTREILHMINYLHEHYQEKFSLTGLAEHMSTSRNECCRYFKKIMNMTITEYLLEYRLSKAAELLSSNYNITEIAEKTGFCDTSYFIKLFKQKTGMTPKAYQKNMCCPQK